MKNVGKKNWLQIGENEVENEGKRNRKRGAEKGMEYKVGKGK